MPWRREARQRRRWHARTLPPETGVCLPGTSARSSSRSGRCCAAWTRQGSSTTRRSSFGSCSSPRSALRASGTAGSGGPWPTMSSSVVTSCSADVVSRRRSGRPRRGSWPRAGGFGRGGTLRRRRPSGARERTRRDAPTQVLLSHMNNRDYVRYCQGCRRPPPPLWLEVYVSRTSRTVADAHIGHLLNAVSSRRRSSRCEALRVAGRGRHHARAVRDRCAHYPSPFALSEPGLW